MAEREWKSVTAAVTRLFELKRYPELKTELPALNEKVRTIFKSDLGNFLGEYYHDNVMRQCMTKLKEEVERAEHGGRDMIGKLAEVWTQFYTSILPTLLAFFASVQPQQDKLSIRALTLISFRDYVLLQLNFSDALRRTSGPLPPQIQQMLLVLQTVHKSTPTEEFFALQKLVGQVVDNYFPMITRTKSMAEKRLPLNDAVQSNGAGLEGGWTGADESPGNQPRKTSHHRRGHSLDVEKDQIPTKN